MELLFEKSPYFEIQRTVIIESIEQLVGLTEKRFHQDSTDSKFDVSIPSSGIFRGQSHPLSLVPTSYRYKLSPDNDLEDQYRKKFYYLYDNRKMDKFIKAAQKQNNEFPAEQIEQAIIAQHYGIPTPLLDWTKNLLVAAYFALDTRREEEWYGPGYIYHIKNERDLKEIPNKDLHLIERTCYVPPSPLDRRIDRQFGCFTFHPHPKVGPISKLKITRYKLESNVIANVWRLLENLGFTSSYLFPDYAGLANQINREEML